MNDLFCAITGKTINCLNSYSVSVPLDGPIEPVDVASLEALIIWAQQQIAIRDGKIN